LFLKWNIKIKIDETKDKEKNLNITRYKANLEMLGIETDVIDYIYVLEDLNDKSLNFVINSPKKGMNIFYNVKKL
jgi:hypothetical protein